jgi:hypothetical protein
VASYIKSCVGRSIADEPLRIEDHELAAAFHTACVRAGIAPSHVDMVVCTVAKRLDAAVFTTDRDFAAMPPLLTSKCAGSEALRARSRACIRRRAIGYDDEVTTTLELDDALLAEAQELGRHASEEEAVTAALDEYVRKQKRLRLIEFFGAFAEPDSDYDYKAERRRATVWFDEETGEERRYGDS